MIVLNTMDVNKRSYGTRNALYLALWQDVFFQQIFAVKALKEDKPRG